MKIKCVALINADGKIMEFSPWLTLGATYHVLSILKDRAGGVFFQILTSPDKGIESVGIHPAQAFDIVSDYRPSRWLDREIDGAIETSPASWQVDGFWESLFEGDFHAVGDFERERRLMLNEER